MTSEEEVKKIVIEHINLWAAVARMQKAAKLEGNWYTFLPCEYAEAVDEALNLKEGSK